MSDEMLQSSEALSVAPEDASSDLPEVLRPPEKKVGFGFLIALGARGPGNGTAN